MSTSPLDHRTFLDKLPKPVQHAFWIASFIGLLGGGSFTVSRVYDVFAGSTDARQDSLLQQTIKTDSTLISRVNRLENGLNSFFLDQALASGLLTKTEYNNIQISFRYQQPINGDSLYKIILGRKLAASTPPIP